MRNKYSLLDLIFCIFIWIFNLGAVLLALYGAIISSYKVLWLLLVIVIILVLLWIGLIEEFEKEGLIPPKEQGRRKYGIVVGALIVVKTIISPIYLLSEAKDVDEFDRRKKACFRSIITAIFGIVGTFACWGYYLMLLFPNHRNIIGVLITIATFGFSIGYSTQATFEDMTLRLREKKFDKDEKKAKGNAEKDVVKKKNRE